MIRIRVFDIRSVSQCVSRDSESFSCITIILRASKQSSILGSHKYTLQAEDGGLIPRYLVLGHYIVL